MNKVKVKEGRRQRAPTSRGIINNRKWLEIGRREQTKGARQSRNAGTSTESPTRRNLGKQDFDQTLWHQGKRSYILHDTNGTGYSLCQKPVLGSKSKNKKQEVAQWTKIKASTENLTQGICYREKKPTKWIPRCCWQSQMFLMTCLSVIGNHIQDIYFPGVSMSRITLCVCVGLHL